jgi:hypothetical protein
LGSIDRTDFIKLVTGVLYTVIGPSKLAGFVTFSWLGFWGLFLCYRAFRLAIPEGRARSYAILLFFLPSVLFWPSSLGKEAWMLFTLGTAAFGAARLLTGSAARGLVLTGIGLSLAAFVRPHVTAFAAMALVAGFVARKPKAELGQLATFAKLIAVAASVAVSVILVQRTEESLTGSRIDAARGIRSVAEDVTQQTQQGRSEFTPYSILASPANAPLAAATVLFRPFIFEANNVQALATAVESSLFLVLALVRLRSVGVALRSIRRRPYVAYALAFTALSVAALSAVANFGILARQRTLLLPFALVLISMPRRSARLGTEPAGATVVPSGSSTAGGTRGA